MAKFNRYMESHFAGCRQLAKTRDVFRERDVQVFMIPGDFEMVGVTDGTDAWVAPVIADPFRVNVARILRDIRDGKDPVLEVSQRRRVLQRPEPPPPTEVRARRTLNREPAANNQTTQRRRLARG